MTQNMSYTTALGIIPVFSINKGGEDITSNFADRVVLIKVESRDGGGDADVIDISLDDRDWIIATPSIGEGSQTVQVNLGYAETVMYDMGTFQIDDLFYEWTPNYALARQFARLQYRRESSNHRFI